MTSRTGHGVTPNRLFRAVRRRVPVGRPGPSAAFLGPAGGRHIALVSPDRLRPVRRWLRDSTAERVLVLTTGATDWTPGHDSVVVREARTMADVVREVQKFGDVDAILDLLPTPQLPEGAANHYELFSRLFFHLGPGGVYLVDGAAQGHGVVAPSPSRWRHLLSASQESDASRSQVAVADAVGNLVVARSLVLVTKVGRHYLKLRERDLDEVLGAREPATEYTLLASRPAGFFDARSVETNYGTPARGVLPERVEYPAMSLRHYVGDLNSAGGMRLFTGNTVLPDSFRWYFSEYGGEARLDSVNREFARIAPYEEPRPKRTLPGDYYYLDCIFDGHFGHLTTEVVSRLWGWDEAKRQNPDLKALFHTRPKRKNDPRLERELFGAFGIRESDLVWVRRPTRVTSLVTATPMWQDQHPHFAHPDIQEVWQRLTAGLLEDGEPTRHERIFVSRGPKLASRRSCRNQAQVESFFVDRGFHVFYPEDVPLSEQVALFAGARVVAGFAGSAMFNLMHARRLEATIVLGHGGYHGRNEHLFSAVLGGELHYFWSPPDIPPPPSGRSVQSDRSSWHFDFDEYAGPLERVLAAH